MIVGAHSLKKIFVTWKLWYDEIGTTEMYVGSCLVVVLTLRLGYAAFEPRGLASEPFLRL